MISGSKLIARYCRREVEKMMLRGESYQVSIEDVPPFLRRKWSIRCYSVAEG